MESYFPDDALAGTQDPTQAPVSPEQQDPLVDQGEIDIDQDGTVDGVWWTLDSGTVAAVIDTTGDDVADVLQFDTDGDGLVDIVLVPDGDGFVLKTESEPDGVYVTREELQEGAPQLAEIVDDVWPTAPGGDEQQGDPRVVDGQLVGDPAERGLDWFQQAFDGSCMPASIAQVATFYTGQDWTDLQFISLINELHAWYPDPDGGGPSMTADGAVKVLNSFGIPAHTDEGTVQDLVQFMDEDRAIIVTIDSGEVWNDQAGKAPETEDNRADHAVTVTGIDTEKGIVYLNDTGTPDGAAMEVPLDVFIDAWADSGNEMVVCDQTADEFRDAQGIAFDESVEPVTAAADGIPLTLPESPAGPLDGIADFVRTHPVVILPVLIAAAAVVRTITK